MENLADDKDREIRKEIAASGTAGEAPTIFTRAFQYFFVPMAILGVCVGLYVLVSVIVADKRDPRTLIKEFRAGGPHARKYAALQLTQILVQQIDKPDQTLTPDLLAAYKGLKSDEIEVRVYLIKCIGLLRDSHATASLLEDLMKDPDLTIKTACLDALGTIQDRDSIPEILNLLDHSEALVRKYAVYNLGAVCGSTAEGKVVERMRALLKDTVEDVRWNAAFSLAYFMKDATGREILRSMLDRPYLEKAVGADPEKDALVRHAMTHASLALTKIQDKESLPLFREVGAQDRDQEVRRVAQEATRELEK